VVTFKQATMKDKPNKISKIEPLKKQDIEDLDELYGDNILVAYKFGRHIYLELLNNDNAPHPQVRPVEED